jgi:superoxide reductase
MTKMLDVFKCMKCGNVVEAIADGGGGLVCCGQPMKLMDEKTKEGAGEKHLPVIEATGGGVMIKVGSVPHPMEADHWIQFIEVIRKDGKIGRKDLKPGDKPEAFFTMNREDIATVRELCNKHGLWSV